MLKDYIVLDLETTGFNAKEERIIEIGAIKYVDGKKVEEMETFVNPGKKIPPRITEVTGIDDSMVKDAPYIADVIGRLVEFTEGFVIIGHNIMFDYTFIKQNALNNKFTFERKVIDTLKISRKFLNDLENRKLDYLCRYFGIEDENHHRAINDAYAAGRLYEILCDKFEKDNPDDFKPCEAVCKIKKECPITPRQADWLKALVKYHNIDIDYDIDKLTKNAASRNIDIILRDYGRIPLTYS